MKQILFLSLLTLCLSSSSPFNTSDELLIHKNVNLENEYIGIPGPIISFNDGFIGIEYDKSSFPLFQLNKKNTLYAMTHFGIRGQGPTDFISAANIQYINKNIVGVYDRGSNSYKEIIISNKNIKSLKFERSYFRVNKINHSKYIGLSSADGLFHLIDSTGKKKDVFFEYPYKDRNELSQSNSTRAMSYQGMIVTNPQNTKLVYTSNYGEIIHFYNIDNDQITLIEKIEKDYPVYEKVNLNNSLVSKLDFKKTLMGYISLTASDNYLYTLYCGKKIEDLIEGMTVNKIGNQIRVFDWNGKLIRTLQLDVPCMHISVSMDGKRLWALALIPEATPVYFELE